MKRPYFLKVVSVYDSQQIYPENHESEIGPRIFTPANKYFYAYKKPGEQITVEVEVEDWDTAIYAMSPDVDMYCGESYGRA